MIGSEVKIKLYNVTSVYSKIMEPENLSNISAASAPAYEFNRYLSL